MIRLLPFLFLSACASTKPTWDAQPLLPEPSQSELKQQVEERRILNYFYLP